MAPTTGLLAGAAVTMLLLSGCAGSPEATPTSTASEDVKPSAPAPTPTQAAAVFLGGTLEQTLTLAQMQRLPLEDFAKLGFGDRIAYAIETVGGEAFPDVEADRNSFIDEAWGIPGFYWQQAAATAYIQADPDTRAKLAGSYAYYTTDKQDGEISDSYQAAANDAVQNGGEGIGSNLVWEYIDSGEAQEGVDRDGNPIYFMNVSYKTSNDPDALESAQEKTGQAIRTEIKLLDGTTVAFYALGYTIDGRDSPDKNYPY